MNKTTRTIIVAVIGLAVGFYAGIQYGKGGSQPASQGSQIMRQSFGGNGQGSASGTRRSGVQMGGGFVGGEVIGKDDKSITVKLRDGGSKIVFYSGSTTVSKSVSGTVGDVSTGTQVVIDGTANSDGSVTAKNIQIRPQAPQRPQ